ncbi:MAG: hypothetical protein JXR70_09190 [Spirochaetales bacterium]|nr:hypothetical protein [Spirochaetales bacterium]
MFVMLSASLITASPRVTILAHSTSYEITGDNPDNVTSYFFSFYSLDHRL